MSLADHARSDAFDDTERACLALADAMTATPAVVSDATYAAVAERFTPAQIVELTATIAWENFRARHNRALGVESDGFSEGAVCPLPVPAGG